MEGIWRQWWRLGGAAGIIFVVLFLIGVGLQADEPLYDDSIEDIRAYWVDDGQQYLIGDYLIGVGFAFFFLPFLVSLRSMLGRVEGGVQVWSRVAFAAAIIALIWGAASSFFTGTLAFGDYAKTAGEAELRLLMNLGYYSFSSGLSMTFAVFVLATSLVIYQTGVVWRWVAGLGAIVGILGTLGPLGVLSANPESFFDALAFVALIGVMVWVLLVSVGMLMRQEEPPQTA